MRAPKQPNVLATPFNLAVLAAYFHAFMEWLFFVTQSSSLSLLPPLEKGRVLFITGGILAAALTVLLLLLALPARKWKALACLPSALMLAVTALVMLDNFTYTLFKLGIVTASGAWRIVYTAVFIFLFVWIFRRVQRQKLWKRASFLTLSLLAVSTVGIVTAAVSRQPYRTGFDPQSPNLAAKRPNIIVLGGDGLSASYLSAYGFSEDTTPFLAELVWSSLVAENAFPNASSTTASTASALTGKEPAEVGVYRYPDILSKEDSFEHLPGILKEMGYKTVEIGAAYYVDARKLNLLNGFDIVNNASFASPWLEVLRPLLGNSPSAYFIELVAERAGARLLHIFFVEEMENPFEQVNDPHARMTDSERVEEIIRLLEDSDRPIFIFSHFMNTHGPHFSSETRGSPEESTNEGEEWDAEQYKEAIRSFDRHVKDVYTYLAESGELENTILVIYTDHGYRYVVNQRIPLIIRFPNGEHAGSRKNNVQIIDLPPTLLDYLGVPQPEWMTGTSLLKGEPPAAREIVSITAGSPKKIKPPFYQIKSVQVIVCQKWYVLNVQENTWKTGTVSGHTAKCEGASLPPEDQIRQKILAYLEKYGYDIRSLSSSP